MYYTYEANLTYSKEDKIWYVDFPEFNGDAYTDADTIEQAVKNAAEVLSAVEDARLKAELQAEIRRF